MTAALLDVNTLIALLDADHVAHHTVETWFATNASDGWVTCPITENAFIRVTSNPRYPNPHPLQVARDALGEATRSEHHRFWPCDVSLLGTTVEFERLLGPKQVTDAYLLALAVAHRGRLVTLDHRMVLSAVVGAADDHVITL